MTDKSKLENGRASVRESETETDNPCFQKENEEGKRYF